MTTLQAPPGKRILALDSLRGIFALCVAIGHAMYWNNRRDDFPLSFVLSVDFFFTLSGFVLTSAILNNHQNFDEWIVQFFKRRIRRLYPIYLLAFLLTLCLIFPFIINQPVNANGYTLAMLLLLGQATGYWTETNLIGQTSIGIAWSVSAELWVGFVFFSFIHICRRHPGLLLVVCAIVGNAALMLIFRNSNQYMDIHYTLLFNTLPFGILRCLTGFSFGTICCVLVRNTYKLRHASIYECSIAMIVVLLYGYTNYDRQNDFLAPALSGLLIFIFSYEQGPISRILRSRYLVLLGKISYPLYLLHPIAMDLVRNTFGGMGNLIVIAYLSLSLFIAYLAHKLIEVKWCATVKMLPTAGKNGLTGISPSHTTPDQTG